MLLQLDGGRRYWAVYIAHLIHAGVTEDDPRKASSCRGHQWRQPRRRKQQKSMQLSQESQEENGSVQGLGGGRVHKQGRHQDPYRGQQYIRGSGTRSGDAHGPESASNVPPSLTRTKCPGVVGKHCAGRAGLDRGEGGWGVQNSKETQSEA